MAARITEVERATASNAAKQVVAEATEQKTQHEAAAAVAEPFEVLISVIDTDQEALINPVYTAPLGYTAYEVELTQTPAPSYAVEPVPSETGLSNLQLLRKSHSKSRTTSREASPSVAVMTSVALPPAGSRMAASRTNPLVTSTRGLGGRVLTPKSTKKESRAPPQLLTLSSSASASTGEGGNTEYGIHPLIPGTVQHCSKRFHKSRVNSP